MYSSVFLTGRFTAHDIAVFAKESASSSVQTLGPEDFPAKITKPNHPFFVDFFAPVSEQFCTVVCIGDILTGWPSSS